MKKFLFWLFIVSSTVSFPNLILAQDPNNLDRTKAINQQMDCVDGALNKNNGIGWNDVCDLADPSSSNNTKTASDNNNDSGWEYSQSLKYSRGKYGTSQESE